MRIRLSLGVVALAVCLAGCSSSTSAPSSRSQASDGTIIGSFRIVGGPSPGINNPLSGTIEIHLMSATGRVIATTTAVSGHFRVAVPPGDYVATGTSARQSGVPCTSDSRTDVRAKATAHLTVSCDVP
jgi:hypothetical protein